MNHSKALPSPPMAVRRPWAVIQPSRGWSGLGLRELWAYRELLWMLTLRDLKGKYRQTALGWLWILIRPFIHMVVFSIIFGGLAKLPSEGLPYPIFTFVAILPWTYFSSSASAAGSSLVSRMNVISKVYFSRLVPPVSAVMGGLVDFAVSSVLLVAMMAYFGFTPPVQVIFVPLYLGLAMLTALAIGLWTANLTVRFRDVSFVVETGIQVWMYATPVAYSADLIPEKWQLLYKLNPLYWVVQGFRWGLLDGGEPPQILMLWPVLGVLILLLSGAYLFRRAERTIVDLQ